MTTLTALKATLDATTDALALHPEAARQEVEASCALVGASTVSSPLGDHVLIFDQAAPLGDGLGPTPGDALLAALGACQAQVYRFWSEKLGIAFDDLRVEVRGDIDVRRLFGADEQVRPGFEGVQIETRVTGPESAARYEDQRRAVDEHCPMLDVVANPAPVTTSIHST